MWDRTHEGAVNNQYRARGIVVEIDREFEKVTEGTSTYTDAAESIRKKIVKGMRIGKPVVMVCGNEFPDFDALRLNEKFGLTWEQIFDYEEFRKPEVHMKLVKECENYNMCCEPGKFRMQDEFNIVIMARYVKEDMFYALIESIPNYDDFMRIAITNV